MQIRNTRLEHCQQRDDHDEAESTCRKGEHDVGLGDKLPDDAAAWGTQRKTYGDLAAARDGETGKKRAHVRAGDQQHEQRNHRGRGACEHVGRLARRRKVIAGQ